VKIEKGTQGRSKKRAQKSTTSAGVSERKNKKEGEDSIKEGRRGGGNLSFEEAPRSKTTSKVLPGEEIRVTPVMNKTSEGD
jgi:hypothetical protein